MDLYSEELDLNFTISRDSDVEDNEIITEISDSNFNIAGLSKDLTTESRSEYGFCEFNLVDAEESIGNSAQENMSQVENSASSQVIDSRVFEIAEGSKPTPAVKELCVSNEPVNRNPKKRKLAKQLDQEPTRVGYKMY